MNALYFGDNLDILKKLHSEHPQGFIDLIYIDPPVNSTGISSSQNKSGFNLRKIINRNCGVFVKYLITSFGIGKFSQLWKTVEANDNSFKIIYNKYLSVLENDFYKYLSILDDDN